MSGQTDVPECFWNNAQDLQFRHVYPIWLRVMIMASRTLQRTPGITLQVQLSKQFVSSRFSVWFTGDCTLRCSLCDGPDSSALILLPVVDGSKKVRAGRFKLFAGGLADLNSHHIYTLGHLEGPSFPGRYGDMSRIRPPGVSPAAMRAREMSTTTFSKT